MKLPALLTLTVFGSTAVPFTFVGADATVDVTAEGEDIDVVGVDVDANNDNDEVSVDNDESGGDEAVDTIDGEGGETGGDRDAPVPLPSSLMKAARVGAKLREVKSSHGGMDENPDEDTEGPEISSPDANVAEDVPLSPKPPLTGCHWGTMGCKKGKMSGAPGDANASAVESEGEDGVKPPPSSSLAGSATAKIEAHVMKGRGRRKSSSPSRWRDSAVPTLSSKKEAFGAGNKPPQGFKLAGRIVTSPSDGLSYFLDSPQVDPEDRDGDWMMTIPFAYLECGPTIESTTEPFSLADMVLRHFPASGSMTHWTNLGGGVTIENDDTDEALGGQSGPKYIEGNHDGRPRLLVALSPIEITVSGNDEESRVFSPGDVILMEDTLGKGHQMRAHVSVDGAEPSSKGARGRDLSVLMVSLPHSVYYPMYDWLDDSSYLSESGDNEETSPAEPSATSPPTSYGAEDALFGFAPKHLHQKPRGFHKRSLEMGKKPCPLEYDSAYSSLFMPSHNPYRGRNMHNRRSPRWRLKEDQASKESSFDEMYPPPPGFSAYEKHSVLFDYLPSLRRTMLAGLGLSLTSSFIYCLQLLYPPLLVLWGGGTMVVGGGLLSVLAMRWAYRNWIANWEEEWRWKREVKKNKMQREEMMKDVPEEIIVDKDIPNNADGANDEDSERDISDEIPRPSIETKSAESAGTDNQEV